jgi:DNA-binding CsgD family transcriptional regulator
MDEYTVLGRVGRPQPSRHQPDKPPPGDDAEFPLARHRAASVTSVSGTTFARRYTDPGACRHSLKSHDTDPIIESLDRALITLNPHGYILRANAMARELLGRGAIREAHDGRLIVGDAHAQDAFQSALSAFEAREFDTFRLHRPIGDGRWFIFDLRYLDKDNIGAAEAEIVVKIRSTGDDAPRGAWTATVRSLRLTPAEADVAMCIFSALTAKEIAKRLDVSPNTVKSHLRAIYAKAGCAGYSETLSLLLSLTRP